MTKKYHNEDGVLMEEGIFGDSVVYRDGHMVRVDPVSGVIQKDDGFLGSWNPVINDNLRIERVNPETKELEEGHIWGWGKK